MVQKVSQNLDLLGISKRVSFRQGDIQTLPFEDNSLDFIVSTLSLHHWSEPKRVLSEISRILKPGGQFLIFDLRRDSWRLVYWIIKFAQTFVMPTVMRRVNEPINSFLACYTPGEMEALLSEAAFRQGKVKPGIFWLLTWGYKG
jgi:ubiquinone/menaquinone biosynthesis C-methylase UbiE